ncbi:MAG: menaquinone biosynthesis decarboxylase [Thermaerobacter sp.]|nr:menaquinone biosynthesis decarboxylase [Thermaerobacter sp.]
MAFRDLHEFAAELERRGLLRRIGVEVDPELEITEIADRVMKRQGPALLFERVRGSAYPVLINAFGSSQRIELALGTQDLTGLGEELARMAQPPEPPAGLLDKLKALPKLAQLASFFPKVVKSAPVQEVVEEDPDLTALPVLKCWPADAGRFVTLPLVATRDPLTGRRNLGMYRLQVYDRRTTGMHWHMHKDGAEHLRRSGGRLEAAVALGGDPATIYAATAPLPAWMDEYVFAGFVRRAPVELVRCRTVDLEVPAHADFVLEGWVDAAERRVEGPFGDHTGFYSPAEEFPVFHVTCVTRRREPWYPATVVGPPPMEDAFLGLATERLFLPLVRMQLPEVVDMHMPAAGAFHNLVLVSIRKRYPGQARKVMHALWGLGLMMLAKVIVVLDEDVEVHDANQVLWKALANIDPQRDLEFAHGPVDALEHASPHPYFGSKVGVDATRKLASEGHPRSWPEEIRMSPEVVEQVTRRWSEYGLGPDDQRP